jgi:hypothetical protein
MRNVAQLNFYVFSKLISKVEKTLCFATIRVSIRASSIFFFGALMDRVLNWQSNLPELKNEAVLSSF